jgi:hypothetical protein
MLSGAFSGAKTVGKPAKMFVKGTRAVDQLAGSPTTAMRPTTSIPAQPIQPARPSLSWEQYVPGFRAHQPSKPIPRTAFGFQTNISAPPGVAVEVERPPIKRIPKIPTPDQTAAIEAQRRWWNPMRGDWRQVVPPSVERDYDLYQEQLNKYEPTMQVSDMLDNMGANSRGAGHALGGGILTLGSTLTEGANDLGGLALTSPLGRLLPENARARMLTAQQNLARRHEAYTNYWADVTRRGVADWERSLGLPVAYDDKKRNIVYKPSTIGDAGAAEGESALKPYLDRQRSFQQELKKQQPSMLNRAAPLVTETARSLADTALTQGKNVSLSDIPALIMSGINLASVVNKDPLARPRPMEPANYGAPRPEPLSYASLRRDMPAVNQTAEAISLALRYPEYSDTFLGIAPNVTYAPQAAAGPVPTYAADTGFNDGAE